MRCDIRGKKRQRKSEKKGKKKRTRRTQKRNHRRSECASKQPWDEYTYAFKRDIGVISGDCINIWWQTCTCAGAEETGLQVWASSTIAWVLVRFKKVLPTFVFGSYPVWNVGSSLRWL